MNDLNIVLAPDDNYIVPTMVTISSILSSSNKDSMFNVYIFCAKEFSQAGRQQIASIEKKYERVTVTFIEIDDTRLKSAVTTAHVSAASYYRLYISNMLQVERCLYIDGDMIIKEDLSEIYN
ncbi:MAG: hypothetical protein NC131_21445, partial [Roseburia sp.]|nr:hypothetical protein [Roseburia sp.]